MFFIVLPDQLIIAGDFFMCLIFNKVCNLFKLTILFILSGFFYFAQASDVEFDETFLNSVAEKVDINSFKRNDYFKSGFYDSDIYLNDILIKRDKIFLEVNSNKKIISVIDLNTLQSFGLDLKKVPNNTELSNLIKIDSQSIVSLIPGSSMNFEMNNLELKISIPQAYLAHATDRVDNSLWDSGMSAFFSDYQSNFYKSKNYNIENEFFNINFRNGFNLAGWRFRNESTLNGGSNTKYEFRSNRLYAERDINFLKSKISIGELYTSGEIFESSRFKGFQISSELGMLSNSELSYAPVVRGIAETNAMVEIRQNGYVIYSNSVPPGPFEFRDLNTSGSNGDLLVRIIESDGRVKEYRQSYSYQPVMIRQGNLRYNFTIGKYNLDDLPSPSFINGTGVYGLFNNLTGFGGLILSSNYFGLNTGIGINSAIGGISFDVTTSSSKNYEGKNDKGFSSRILYSKTLNSTNTTFTVAGYRYSTEGFRTFNQHVVDNDKNLQFVQTISNQNSQKSRFNLRVNQTLFNNKSIYISMDETTYWRYIKPTTNWQIGFNGSNQKFSYGAAISHIKSHSYYDNDDTQITLTMNIPLGKTRSVHNLSNSIVSSKSGGETYQSTLSGFINSDSKFGYMANLSQNKLSGTTTGFSLNTDMSTLKLQGGFNKGKNTEQINFSASGSIMAHAGGVTFGQPVGDTFSLIEIPNVKNATISGWPGVKTNKKGFAILPYIQPYRYNWINLNTESLGTDTEIDENSKVVVPTRGSITKVKYASTSGRRIQFKVYDEMGETIPLGAQVFDQNSKLLGLIDNHSKVLTFGINDKGYLKVIWGDKTCFINYSLPDNDSNLVYQDVIGECKID